MSFGCISNGGEPYWFELIDKRQNNKTPCKGFIKNGERLYQYNHIRGILTEMEKGLQEWDRNKKLSFLPPPNLVPPM